MGYYKNTNFAMSQLNANILAAATSCILDDGGEFDNSEEFIGVFWDGSMASPSMDANREIVHAKKVSGNTFDITRAHEGTLAKSWSLGANFACTITAGKIDELEDAIQSGSSKYAVATGTNTYNVTLDPVPNDYENGMLVRTKFVNVPTSDCSFYLNGLGIKNLYGVVNGTLTRLGAGDFDANLYAHVMYDATLDAGAGGWVIINYSFDSAVGSKSWVLQEADSSAPDDTKVPTWTKVLNAPGTPTLVTTQAEFDAVFNGTTLQNTSLYLVLSGSPYLFKSNVPVGANILIDADPGVVVQRSGNVRFHSTGSAGSVKQNVKFTHNWTFDGQGGMDTSLPNSGGSTVLSVDGGFFLLDYNSNCVFDCHITNCATSGNGGAFKDDNGVSSNITISNVSYCKASSGGGVAYISGSTTQVNEDTRNKISNVRNCEATNEGGGVYYCHNSFITDIHHNEAGHGGGCARCNHSIGTYIHNNESDGNAGGWYYGTDCTLSHIFANTGNQGGGVAYADNCNISHVYENTSNGYGGGCARCDSCAFTNIYDNTATTLSGGGCYHCDDSIFQQITGNTATNGGGCSNCDNSVFLGSFAGNTADAGNNDYLNGCLTSLAFAIATTSNALVQTTQGTLNWT